MKAKLITKYLFTTIISYVLLVMLFMLGLQMFVEFMHEFSNIGVGDYGLYRVFVCVLLMLPYDIYQFFPMICLLGSIIGLGLLASHSELIVMRTAGLSLFNITMVVIKVALVLLVIMVFVGEVLSPLAQRTAVQIKAKAMSGGKALLTKQGGWLYNGRSITNINSVSSDGKLEGITRYQFGDDLKLKSVSYAPTGLYKKDGWVLKNVRETQFKTKTVGSKRLSKKKLSLNFSPKLIGMIHADPDQKTLLELYSYIKSRFESGLDISHYSFAFWQRIFAPLATLVMLLLAIPFVLVSLRTSTMGFRMLVGVMLGFGFYLLNQFVGPMSVVYQVPPILAAVLPILVFAVIGGIILSRVR